MDLAFFMNKILTKNSFYITLFQFKKGQAIKISLVHSSKMWHQCGFYKSMGKKGSSSNYSQFETIDSSNLDPSLDVCACLRIKKIRTVLSKTP
jgi:hypothetical protein